MKNTLDKAVRSFMRKIVGASIKGGQLVVHKTRSEAIISNPRHTKKNLVRLLGAPVETKHALEFNVKGKGKIVLRHKGDLDILQLISL